MLTRLTPYVGNLTVKSSGRGGHHIDRCIVLQYLLDMLRPVDAMLSMRRDDTVLFTSLEPGGISSLMIIVASLERLYRKQKRGMCFGNLLYSIDATR
jgi:hypothetical protein